jgi:hypothetical protein
MNRRFDCIVIGGGDITEYIVATETVLFHNKQ